MSDSMRAGRRCIPHCTIGVFVGRRLLTPLIVSLDRRARSIWKLPIERFTISDTAPQKLGPRRDGDIFWNWLWEQTPELWMEPAQIVAATVTMGSNAVPQPDHFGNQLLSAPAQNVRIHGTITPMRFHRFSACTIPSLPPERRRHAGRRRSRPERHPELPYLRFDRRGLAAQYFE